MIMKLELQVIKNARMPFLILHRPHL